MNLSVSENSAAQVKALVEFYSSTLVLKKLSRTGWLVRGVPAPEHVADHSQGVALLTLLVSDFLNKDSKTGPPINTSKAVTMAVVHEIGEVGIGDWTPSMSRLIGREKDQLELNVIQEMTESLESSGARIKDLFLEFMECVTVEARVVRACDKLEMYLQAIDYLKSGQRNLDDFIKSINPDSPVFNWNPGLARLAEFVKQLLLSYSPDSSIGEH